MTNYDTNTQLLDLDDLNSDSAPRFDETISSNGHFGEHVTIDGYQGDFARLDSRNVVLSALQDLPNRLGMKCLTAPEVYRADGNAIKDPGGWTGFVVIEESHISIHTFPEVRFVSIDVYTCRNGLDASEISAYFSELFGLKKTEVNFLKRGLRFAELALVPAKWPLTQSAGGKNVSP
jgi:S-adenosylmethionine decarboxylase